MARCAPLTATTRARAACAVLCLLAVVSAVLLAACGGAGTSASPTGTTTEASAPAGSPSPITTPPASPSATSALGVYFLRGEALGVAARQVPQTTKPATAAVEALCAGPSASETAAGLTSAVPTGTRLLGLSIHGTTARVDLSAQFASGGGSVSMQARVAQVVYTLTQFPTIKAVDFMLDGAPLKSLGGEGLILEPAQTRADWADFEPPIFVERPGAGAVLESPFVLEGSAVVFEGSFMAELTDEAGKRLVRLPVQASAGGPERGGFRELIRFSTSATSGTLIVYDRSLEDGSRQDEVRIPVTLAQQ